MQELPTLSIRQNLRRAVAPKAMLLLVSWLAVVIVLSSSLQMSSGRKMLLSGMVGMLSLIVTVAYVMDHGRPYHMFRNKIIHKGREKLYNEITNFSFKRGLLDKIFGTCILVLEPGFEVKHINDDNQLVFNVQKLVEESRNFVIEDGD